MEYYIRIACSGSRKSDFLSEMSKREFFRRNVFRIFNLETFNTCLITVKCCFIILMPIEHTSCHTCSEKNKFLYS